MHTACNYKQVVPMELHHTQIPVVAFFICAAVSGKQSSAKFVLVTECRCNASSALLHFSGWLYSRRDFRTKISNKLVRSAHAKALV